MRSASDVMRWSILWVFALGLGCTVFVDTSPLGGVDDPVDTVEDASDAVPDGAGDTDVADDPDAEGDVEVDAEVSPPTRNGCGGFGLLRQDGEPVEPGAACGVFGEGRLVCSSLETVLCLGQAVRNPCGGQGVLPVTLGTPCGFCDDGIWACAGEGDVACLGAQESNGCGGCSGLGGRPGGRCVADGAASTWVCTTRESLLCLPGTVNACGGEGALAWEGAPAGPGEACATQCGEDDGVLICAGDDRLECIPTSRAVPPNACGGCGPLPGAPGSSCGLCGSGQWACAGESGGMVCEGATSVDACGGCSGATARPGEACGAGRTWVCDGTELLCAAAVVDPEPGLRNACGGTTELAGEPDDPCGDCGRGRLVCSTQSRVSCVGDLPGNVCGGCEVRSGRENDACGVCGTGRLGCDGTDLTCIGDQGPAARNACGGCGTLAAEPGDACGACLSWACTAAGGLRCEADPGQEGCSTLLTCDDLDCADEHRHCEDSNGELDASCGGCLAGYEALDGVCTSLLAAPANVAASQGTSAAFVEVTWEAVAGASGYHVYRDGTRITTVPVTGTAYGDTDASAGGAPHAVSGVSATVDRTDGVEVSWQAAASSAGDEASYQVRALAGEQESDLSEAVTGFRPPFPVTGYAVQVDGGPWLSAEGGTPWLDTSAPAGTVTVASATATRDQAEGVELAVDAAGTTPGASRSYRIRALNAAGEGAASAAATGRRDVDGVTYQWQWSATQAGPFADATGGAARTATDAQVPPGETRWYRVVVRADGAEEVTSEAVEGRRPLRCGDLEPTCGALNRDCVEGSGSGDADCGGCASGFEEVGGQCVSPLAAPIGVSASQGTSSEHVEVTWEALPGVSGYHVYRNGTRITSSLVTGTSYQDANAPGGGTPSTVSGVSATGDRTDAVVVTWEAGTSAPGASAAYRVRAVAGAQESGLSDAVSGFRGALAVTAYEVQVDDGAWEALDTATQWTDTAAPAGSVTVGTPSASQDQSSGVALSVVAASTTLGAERSYRVRALNAAGTGGASSAATGRRSVGEVGYQWQWSAEQGGAFDDLDGGDARLATDAAVAAGETRWYRVLVRAEGAEEVTSEAVEGRRPLRCGDLEPTCGALNRDCVEGSGSGDADCGGCASGFEEVGGQCVSPLAAPIGVSASQGTSSEHVEVTWEALPGVSGYHVYRNGTRITSSLVTGTSHQDANAPGGGTPSTVSGVSATGDRTDAVVVTWEAGTSAPGASASYRVRAVAGAQESGLSDAVSGFRGALAVTAYEVQVDGGAWETLGTATQWTDTAAPAGSVTVGTPSASQDQSSSVALSVVAASTTQGAQRSYRVRALNAVGAGGASSAATGRRSVGEVGYQWQWSAEQGGAFEDLDGGEARLATDAEVAAGAARWYRVVVRAEGAEEVTSEAVEGRRPLRCGDLEPPCGALNRDCVEGSGSGDAVCGGCASGFEEVGGQCVSPLAAPIGVSASQGTSTAHVALTWEAVSEATGYHVYRDGARITTAPVTGTSFEDTEAPAGGAPSAVSGVSATEDRTDTVEVSWDAGASVPGASVPYQVRAVGDGQESGLSESTTGFRGALPVTGYEVEVDNAAWVSAGSDTQWSDAGAPAGSVTVGTPSATQDLADRVELSVVAASTTQGASRSYRVRALNAAGAGDASAVASGRRTVGTVGYQWQWSATQEGSFANLGQGNTRLATDAEVPVGATRWYRVVVIADGASAQTSNVVEGRRPLRCGDLQPTCGALNRDCVEGAGSTDAVCGGCSAGFEEVGDVCLSPLAAPLGVSASQGTSTAHVVVTWEAVSEATGYHVYRDGARITTAPVTGTSFEDTEAPAGGAPSAVSGVSATEDRTVTVDVSWDAGASVPGASVPYQVRAVTDAQASGLSDAAAGFRGAFPVTGYQVQVGEGAWASAGSGTTWADTLAPPGSLTVGVPTATDDLADGVELAVVAASTTQGALRSYRVRALNAAGAGEASSVASGRRTVGPVGYQWQWSSTPEGSFADLGGGASRTATDAEVPEDETRWYRVVVSAAGASSVTSSAVEGRRAGSTHLLGSSCTSDSQCPPDAWCPTDTNERRCAPLPAVGGVEIPFQWVPQGEFTMGSPSNEVGRNVGNEMLVSVTLSQDYFVQRTPVTQGQWSAVVEAWNALPTGERTMSGWTGATPTFGTTPSCFRGESGPVCTTSGSNPNHPVERVSWWDAVVYANALSILEGLTPCYTLSSCGTGTGVASMGGGCSGTGTCFSGNFECGGVTFVGKSCSGYRLLTEAEWERAARGGTTTATYNGNLAGTDCSNSTAVLDPIAWYTCNSDNVSYPVGSKSSNAWGLHDTLGNVSEWTWTWYAAAQSGGDDPLGPPTGSLRVFRGGSWFTAAGDTRAAYRDSNDAEARDARTGFRLARTVPVEATLDCSALDAPTNGSVSAPSTVVDAVAEYACDPGYVLEGPEERVCLSSGEWSGEAPACFPELALTEVCEVDSQCPSGSWCPTDTSERRCSPRPEIGGVEMAFQWVPSGEFTMGSPEGEVGRSTNEAQVEVTLTRDYFVQRTPVTQGQWSVVMETWNARPSGDRTMSGWPGATPTFGTTPSCFRSSSGTSCTTSGSSPDHPVERVNWWDAVVYANVLSVLEGLTPCYTLTGCAIGTGVAGVGGGCSETSEYCSSTDTFGCVGADFVGKSCSGYRLLTEAEWERAVRGGTTTATYNGNLADSTCATSSAVLDPIAWYFCNSGSRTHAVGQKSSNAWGLHDMLGNVWEWTWTWYATSQSGGADPLGPSTGATRVHRGGSWFNDMVASRAAFRFGLDPRERLYDFGFRLARSAPVDSAVDCGALAAPTNGSVSAPDTAFQSVAAYACDPGYALEGSDERVCLSSGEWSGTAPWCSLALCTSDDECPSGSWCPTDTSERRCSPRPEAGGVQMPFQWVPRGTFTMGSPSGEVGRFSNEAQVEVTLSRDYFVQRTPVTQGQWAAVMEAWNARASGERTMSGWSGATPLFGTNPSYFGTAGVNTCSTPTCPVERVSWWDAVVYANVLSLLEGLTPCYTLTGCGTSTGVAGVGGGCSGTSISCSISGNFSCSGVTFVGKSCSGYRLLTEAEWERAARGGTTTATYNGNLAATDCSGSAAVLDPIAWYSCNSGSRTQAVGQKSANSWGLYDMLGNVWEWTWTWYVAAQSGGMDPLGPETGSDRVVRGGSWGNAAQNARAAIRLNGDPGYRVRYLGFRLARSAP